MKKPYISVIGCGVISPTICWLPRICRVIRYVATAIPSDFLLATFEMSVINPDKLHLQELTINVVSDFLDNQQETRNVSVATRNQRLAALQAFAKYVSMNSPEHMEWSRNIRNIPKKKAPKKNDNVS